MPTLDAVLFISAKNSQIEVVQSVGRVMRRAEGKKYGYIIIPIVIPSGVEPENALDDNERYKVVWTVLNALRSHDDRFNATINKIELNTTRPDIITVVKPAGMVPDGEGKMGAGTGNKDDKSTANGDEDIAATKLIAEQLRLKFEELQDVIYGKLVKKVGSKKYWDEMAHNVKRITETQIKRITEIVSCDMYQSEFDKFLITLQKDINPSITKQKAVEMLSQHIITQPIFEALFEGYSFAKNNPISIAMSNMLNTLHETSIQKEMEKLQKDYDELRRIASGFTDAEAKQKFIVKLYDVFFKTAFPQVQDELGIVYTPVEVVDFIIHSVNDILKQEFGRTLSDENVNILDPFTGTGTFITRLLQSGLIETKDIARKYNKEIFANELVLLAYYIAAVNIENVYHDIIQSDYQAFNGICLTDTFQLGEADYSKMTEAEISLKEEIKPNSERVRKQMKSPITVIMGNPPYRIGQASANDNTQNQKYTKLEKRIEDTYAKESTASLTKSLYDSYIKAFRWSADRLGNNDGVVAFVSNGGWLDGNSTDGFRKCIGMEYSKIIVLNFRGNTKESGDLGRKEGGNIFGIGCRTPITITLFVKKGVKNKIPNKALIEYYEIDEYLKTKEKLIRIKNMHSIDNIKFSRLLPNEHNDWLNKRNDAFDLYTALAPEKKCDIKSKTFFILIAIGVATNRDVWAWNFSQIGLGNNMQKMVDFYNEQSKLYKNTNHNLSVEDFIDTDSTKISWTVNLKNDIKKGIKHDYKTESIRNGIYRPFTKNWLYYSRNFIERPGIWTSIFPTKRHNNLVICLSCTGTTKGLSVMISDVLADLHYIGDTQCFPLYYYEEKTGQITLTEIMEGDDAKYTRKDGVSDWILKEARRKYVEEVFDFQPVVPISNRRKNSQSEIGTTISKEDIFYYVYGFLHCPEYRKAFANDLKKMLPRIPLVDDLNDFWAFSRAGRELANLHLNYESVERHPDVIENTDWIASSQAPRKESCRAVACNSQSHQNDNDNGSCTQRPYNDNDYKVTKMCFGKNGKVEDKTKIIYNSSISLENIPLVAYEYIVNGKSAIDWIMERYQIKTDKDSGITNDPNDWCIETGNPRYIIDLLHSVINLSVKTVEIVNNLPKVKFEKE